MSVVALSLAAALAVVPSVNGDDDDDVGPAQLFAWPMVAGGLVVKPQAVGGTSQLALSWRPWSFIEPEVVVGAGAFGGTNDYVNRFSFGSRLVLPAETFQPFLWAAFTHAHETAFHDVMAHPVEAMLSVSEAGVAHRSGGEAGIGVVIPIAVQRWEGGEPLRVMFRTTAVYLPDFASFTHDVERARPSHLYLLFEVGVGLPLRFERSALKEPRLHG